MDDDAIYWDCRDVEDLAHSDINDAIEEYLDLFLDPKMTPEEVLATLPETVEVTGYARRTVDRKGLYPLLLLLEHLDDEYGGNEAAEKTRPSDKMLEAEKAFLDVVLSEYKPYWCEPVAEKTINTKEWIDEYRPDWLEVE
jgi:hypothetical protein